MKIAKVGIIGAGQMGSGIAQVCATAGYEVFLNDLTPERIAAGLDGIERQLELPPPTENAYAGDAAPLPRTLAEATRLFRESKMARTWLSDEFVDHYAGTREWEVRQFDKAVTDWELARYLELI